MAYTDLRQLGHLGGWKIQGDVGPLTVYTRRDGRQVMYPRAPPDVPESTEQLHYRNLWRSLGITWQAMTKPARTNWATAAQRAGLGITGFNLWMYYQLRKDQRAIQTIERQTGITLL